MVFPFRSRERYRTLNTVCIYADALFNNWRLYERLLPGKVVCPVLKSNAYGHGLEAVAHILESQKPHFMIVDSLYEAYKLEAAGVKSPILILGYTLSENMLRKKLPYHFALADFESAAILAQQKVKVHLKVDTGMNRMGFSVEDLPQVLPRLKSLNLDVVGLFTHFADADNPSDSVYTQHQLKQFEAALQLVYKAGFTPRWVHVGGSPALLTRQSSFITMFRLGLGLYGLLPYLKQHPFYSMIQALQSALELVSTLVGIRFLEKGQKVSYGGTFVAPTSMTIGIVPLGYYEALPWILSGKGFMEVQGVLCPQIGRICMNYSMIDLTGVASPNVGDQVIVYSRDFNKPHSIEGWAKLGGTFNYELPVRLSESVRREIVW